MEAFIASVSGHSNVSLSLLGQGIIWSEMSTIPMNWIIDVKPKVARDSDMQVGITIMKRDLENIILRDYIVTDDVDTAGGYGKYTYRSDAFGFWLMLARDLQSTVKFIEHEGLQAVAIMDHSSMEEDIVVLGNQMPVGKYKVLDLFSDKGIPLTSRKEVISRRNQLQSATRSLPL